ncbi:MAG: hypothetical protein ACK518_00405 [bacterium]|jgi:hypothetical protein
MISWQLWTMYQVNHKVIAWLYSQALTMKLIAQILTLLFVFVFVPTVMTVMLAQAMDSLPTGSEKLVRTEYMEMK